MHHDRRTGQIGEFARTASMVRVGVRIDDHLETASEVRQHRNIPIDVIAHRVNQRGDMIPFGISHLRRATHELIRQHIAQRAFPNRVAETLRAR